jgi:hypothetical protein
MDDPRTEEDRDALVRIRTQLTVALLAVGRLCRTLGSLPPVKRLCTLATDALLRVRDEVAGIEARIRGRAGHAERASDAADEHPPVP